MQADHPFALHRFRELPAQPVEVGLFHAKDHVGPAHVPLRHHDAGFGLGAGGTHFVKREIVKQSFRGQTAKAIPAANEEQLPWRVMFQMTS
jgi:hypothetical protein